MVDSTHHFNILFSSLSAKIALFESVRKEVESISSKIKVLGADSNSSCHGSQKIKHFVRMPPISELNQESLFNFCQKHKIQFVIPTRDSELLFWAEHQAFLSNKKIGVMVSNKSAIQICEDKYSFASHFKNSSIPAIQTSLCSSSILSDYDHFVVKERMGSASSSIGLNLKPEDLIPHSKKLKEPIFQPQIKGREFSAEAWIDKKGKCSGVLLRWRIEVIDGESHKSVTFKNSDWENRLKLTFKKIPGLKGHILAQVIVDQNEDLHLIEINPRLGGASPLALASGLHSVKWSILEFLGLSNQIHNMPNLKMGLQLIKNKGVVRIQ